MKGNYSSHWWATSKWYGVNACRVSALKNLRSYLSELDGLHSGRRKPEPLDSPRHYAHLHSLNTDPIPKLVDLQCTGSSLVTWPSPHQLRLWWVRVTHHYVTGAARHYSLLGLLCDVQKQRLMWGPGPPACDLVAATKLFAEV